MNQHVKAAPSMAPDLSRRSFLVGTAATGLVLAAALWSTAFFAAPHLAFLGRLQDEAVLGLVVDLAAGDAERLPPPEALQARLNGVLIPRIPVAAGFQPLPLVVAALTTT